MLNNSTTNSDLRLNEAFFAADADLTFTPAMLRRKLGSKLRGAFYTLHDKTNGGYMTVTNSGEEGLDHMMGRRLPFLASNGTIARFVEDGEVATHPGLTMDKDELNHLMKSLAERAVKLIEASNSGFKPSFSGIDILKKRRVAKIENKGTSFFIGHVYDDISLREEGHKVCRDIINILADEFNIEAKGLEIHEGKDGFEIRTAGIDKWSGFQWVMQHEKFAMRTPIIFEDSNPDFLKNAYNCHGAFNVAVGNTLPKTHEQPWIHANWNDVPHAREQFKRIGQRVHDERHGIFRTQWLAPTPKQMKMQFS